MPESFLTKPNRLLNRMTWRCQLVTLDEGAKEILLPNETYLFHNDGRV